jgi:DNA processing protein
MIPRRFRGSGGEMDLAGPRRSANLGATMPRRARYLPPRKTAETTLNALLEESGRRGLDERQSDFLRSDGVKGGKGDVRIFYAGDISLLAERCVSIVGTREVSEAGWLRATRLARELAESKIIIVSGLAKGVDTAALTSAISARGKTIGVIGTPLTKAYPIENHELQETIWQQHLLMTPFAPGEIVFKTNFPKRNRVMAAISDATVIVEASDTSGTLHQAAECQRLGRWLFIMKSVAEDPTLKWPSSFLQGPKTAVLMGTDEILKAIDRG